MREEASVNKFLLCCVVSTVLIAGCQTSNPSGPAGNPGYTLTVDIADAFGRVFVSPEKEFYSVHDTVILSVVDKGSYVFRGWSGDIADTARIVYVVMDSDKTISADFQRQAGGPKVLAISVHATNGTVDYGTSPITVDPATGVFICDSGEFVTLTAKPDTGFQFVQWSGDTVFNAPVIDLTVTHAIELSVVCVQLSGPSAFDTVSIHVPVAGGWVVFLPAASKKFSTGSPPSLDSSYVFPHGEHLTIIARHYLDCSFTSWTGDLTGSRDTMTFDVTAHRSITANFRKDSSTNPAFVAYWKVGGWTFTSSMGGPATYTSGGDTCFLDIRADGTYTGWAIRYYNVRKSTGTWTADNYYIYFTTSDGWDEQVAWQASKGQTSASLSLVSAGESGVVHEMCSR
jgi:hypothetical protein